ncbi:coiled-coil domain-containing protein 40-like protein [Anopheles sinensis]|uniref:Coiled-coil domain-containing protein 40-like protein n=1 Tax=Anopheles sinensis TaxID=74873 RepID=A0A084WLE8_ANOSI|nr:coiled-coil domain-containing protein 40-like protein [Anopheles sinensis]
MAGGRKRPGTKTPSIGSKMHVAGIRRAKPSRGTINPCAEDGPKLGSGRTPSVPFPSGYFLLLFASARDYMMGLRAAQASSRVAFGVIVFEQRDGRY